MKKRLENAGYKITYVIGSGNYIAKKGQRTYTAETITALHKQIFKPL